MADNGQIPDFCLVGEPTCRARLGDVIKIGRRGSLNAKITVHGTQGHAAYPQRADNPVHRLVRALAALTAAPLDAGSECFEPSSLQLTTIDVGNPATNVIPAQARAALNIRFNDRHTGASLGAWLRATIGQHAERFDLDVAISGESLPDRARSGGGRADARRWRRPPGPRRRWTPAAAPPTRASSPGTARWRSSGWSAATMHQADERVPVAELRALAGAYRAVLAGVRRMSGQGRR